MNEEMLKAAIQEHRRIEWLEEQVDAGTTVTLKRWCGDVLVAARCGARGVEKIGDTVREAIDMHIAAEEAAKQAKSESPGT